MNNRLLIPVMIFVLLHGNNKAVCQSKNIDTSGAAESIQSGDSTVYTIIEKQNITISDDSILEYKKRKDFAYIYNLDSLLQHSGKLKVDTINPDNLNRIKPLKNNTNESKSIPGSTTSIFDNGMVKIFLWLLAIGFIVFVLYKLFLGEGMFKKEPSKNKPVNPEGEEAILSPAGYDRLIYEAIQTKNFRLAIRFLYLQALQNLTLIGAVQFTPDKTNYEYVKELFNKSYQNDFASLTLNYEYVWYGRFDINEDLFVRLRKDFNQFHQKIQR